MTSNAITSDETEEAQSNVAPFPINRTKNSDTPYGAAVSLPASNLVIIHARFWPDSRVWEIAECPDGLTKDEWFKLLCARVGDRYETRAGGRGFFRISRGELEALKALTSH